MPDNDATIITIKMIERLEEMAVDDEPLSDETIGAIEESLED